MEDVVHSTLKRKTKQNSILWITAIALTETIARHCFQDGITREIRT